MASLRLERKAASITGSHSGIGQATAIEMAKEGADVVVHFLHDAEGAEKPLTLSPPKAARPSSCAPTSATSAKGA